MRDDEGLGRPKPPVLHEIGSDLASLSLHEIAERIALLEAEIARLNAEAERKRASMNAASALFRS
jgi:uncharacterized small protein (DUF1192 family)